MFYIIMNLYLKIKYLLHLMIVQRIIFIFRKYMNIDNGKTVTEYYIFIID